ncbi:NAD-dependent epimerase [Bradyrhizobium sp. SSBR45G]|uniref:NAD-dependent epimerase/dehydratase family protein n=1 Tax=unclassified Bradyrhizobium TaxID=2631580 RepID=UPI002342A493|nr:MULTISPECIES: SDR family oxidoreductase [unclassified Bradyrhizobium]GLH79943.1 NAD-dependent epimerase [Bradyrhizobium sp. SSBR45G]GLH87319.1 NAD-dependent epimerase [Bradyrhizobium sp. SSBR45R]
MKVLITGNMGYVGPAVARHLRAQRPDATLHGFDNAYFAHCLTGAPVLPERYLDEQIHGDVRDLSVDLRGYDAVVQLAAISNDPMGNRFQDVTLDINQNTTVSLAKAAAAAGVKNFVFASSCSVYGIADGPPRKESDPLNPITAYAKSKIGSEQELAAIDTGMTITCLRFATACGMSDRLRLDLVLNDFVACALTRRQISVLSDGTPWRPLIDVADMARAIDWAVDRPAASGGRFLTVNAGSDDRNYQVRDLANAVAARVPGTAVSINTSAPVDSRSYKVDFGLYRSLAPDHQPQVTLQQSITNLVEGLTRMNFKDAEFRSSDLIRLKVLQDHMDTARINDRLQWT